MSATATPSAAPALFTNGTDKDKPAKPSSSPAKPAEGKDKPKAPPKADKPAQGADNASNDPPKVKPPVSIPKGKKPVPVPVITADPKDERRIVRQVLQELLAGLEFDLRLTTLDPKEVELLADRVADILAKRAEKAAAK